MIPDAWKRHYEDFALKRAAKWALTSWGLVTSPLRLLPDFIVIGAQRAGTTSLYRYLIQHPSARGALPAKGVHYFDTSFEKNDAWYRAHFPTRLTRRYVALRNGTELVTGEGSPYYIFHPHSPQRIADLLPHVKLIAMLRNPVDRAYSHHQHEVARGFEHLTFEEALDREQERLAGEVEKMRRDPLYVSFGHQHHSYLARGLYGEQIKLWHSFFPRDQLLILKSESFFADPGRELERVQRFLGLPAWSPRAYERYNALPRDSMRPETRERLAEYFALPNRLLFDYLGLDYGWNTPVDARPLSRRSPG